MQIFPIVKNLEEFKMSIGDKPEIRFMEQDNGTTIASYIISNDQTFSDYHSKECRGITFNSRNKVISRSLHKFFNVNEKESTLVHNIDWSKIVRIMVKRDGSMICTANIPSMLGNFSLKSKKTFESPVAKYSTNWMKNKSNYLEFCTNLTFRDLTAIFEWTSPDARIVLPYKSDELTLLHIRHNKTGEYFNQNELEEICKDYYDIPLVGKCNDIAELLNNALNESPESLRIAIENLQLTTEDIEGWVIQFENGDMVKLKTKWYCDRHHVMTNIRERDVAKMVINESIDDVKAMLVSEGVDIQELLNIESRLISDIGEIIYDVDTAIRDNKDLDKKSMAIKFVHTNHPYFVLIMQKYSGREPNYNEFYEKNYLSDRFSLRQLNLLQSVADPE